MTSSFLFQLLSIVVFSILLYVLVFLESSIMTTFRYPRVRSAGNVNASHLNFCKAEQCSMIINYTLQNAVSMLKANGSRFKIKREYNKLGDG
jgi:hypothetical protein